MGNSTLVRQLVPTSIHFDGYDMVGCQTRDAPFFRSQTIPMGRYELSVQQTNHNSITLMFQSVCKTGKTYFQPYTLTIDEYASKLQEAVKKDSNFILFEVRTEINSRDCSRCNQKTKDCQMMIKSRPEAVMAAVSFDITDIKRALAGYYEIINNKKGEKINMKKNNFMGMNFEFGQSKDPNLAATLFGVAVRSSYGAPWRTYDPVNKVHKNLANAKLGDFPIFLLPVTSMQPGDLIKRDGKYYWIKEVTSEGTFKAIDSLTGLIHEILPTESLIPGLNLYTKVVAMDMKSLTDPSGNNVANNLLSAMLLMQWSKGGDSKTEFSLDDINENSFNGMGAILPLVLAQSGGGNLANIFGGNDGKINLPMLMMLGGSESDESGFMQMYVLSQLLGGGNTGLESLVPGLTTPNNGAVPTMAPATAGNAVRCEKCGQDYPEGTNFCPKCGAKTQPIVTRCKACGVQLMPGALFCHKCGAKVGGPTTCPACHKEIPEGAAFCPYCGKNLNGDVTPSVPAAVAETPAVVAVPAVDQPAAATDNAGK